MRWQKLILFFTLSLFMMISKVTFAQEPAPEAPYSVGMKQMEFVSPNDHRHLAFALFYPASIKNEMTPFQMFFFTNLHFYKEADPLLRKTPFPLLILSHGRGSNGLYYAWFAEYLASHGYIVAAVYHYRANTYDSTAMYLANKLWQRPRDISLIITYLLNHPTWKQRIDSTRIAVAGHSQGGFTALWIGGATVNPKKYLTFQKHWINNEVIPLYLRRQLPLNAEPALHVKDNRIKAVFAMAPGDVPAFGMDENGLQNLKLPAFIIVGASDTQTHPKENAEFAAKYIPHAKLVILPGRVDHEIFVNECTQAGKDAFPETCIDAPGIDRGKLHQEIGEMAVRFFNTSMPPEPKVKK